MAKKTPTSKSDETITINKKGVRTLRIKKQTYVAFLHAGGPSTEKVASRSLAKLKVPGYAYAFWFFDVTSISITLSNGSVKRFHSERTNESPIHYYGATILSRADIVRNRITMTKKGKQGILEMMDRMKLKRVINDRFNNIDPYHEDAGNIFVEAKQ